MYEAAESVAMLYSRYIPSRVNDFVAVASVQRHHRIDRWAFSFMDVFFPYARLYFRDAQAGAQCDEPSERLGLLFCRVYLVCSSGLVTPQGESRCSPGEREPIK